MKKISAILLVLAMLFAFAACNSNEDTEPTEYTGSYEITWQGLADNDIIGSWKPVTGGVSDEYVLFTPDLKLRVVYGTAVFEADIKYGADDAGNKSAYTEGEYLYGQWVYTVKDGVLTITYPKYDSESEEPTFEEKVFNSVDYTPITLQADENFVKDDSLVGKWTNETYFDSYEFTEDGYLVYHQDYDDDVYAYETEIKMTYTFEDGKLVVSYYDDNSGIITTEPVEYTLEGTKLLFGDSDYYLNGEGDPAVTEAAE